MYPRGSGGGGIRPTPRRGERGMVTVELAVGSITAVLLTACLVSLSMLGVAQSACAESSAQIARQSARGDGEALAVARGRVPRDARVEVRREDAGVVASVRVGVSVLGFGVVDVGAQAWAAYEPGQGP
ncbi:hypothetical protein SAMN02745244_01985 [Tessaracoccus bendigoensis DSM 12906]|uniref:TadE-like protein n=2 Tax=Tessaracoccus TaxID=72763 RepID=A0A1M6HJC2_9ACTN|nr:hypothetical protein SAMN02745244_01985 [Tessaracoccus bendigoensis DSM 12906]